MVRALAGYPVASSGDITGAGAFLFVTPEIPTSCDDVVTVTVAITAAGV